MRKAAQISATLILTVCLLGCGDSTNPSGSRAGGGILIASGDRQTATVGTSLRQALSVRVIDPNGVAVPGQTVTFTVKSGGGALSSLSSTSDGNGIASTQWTLGTSTADSQRVRASLQNDTTDSSNVAVFTATAVPGPAQIAAIAGSGQTASPGSTLPESLVVRVADSYGNPVPNISVAWATTNGGTLTPQSGHSDAQGYAKTQWMLGAAAGLQTVTATAPGLSPVTFSAMASSGTSNITVAILKPTAGITVSDTLSVAATVTSRYELSTVVANIGTHRVPLTYSQALQRWMGTIIITDVQFGTAQVTVTATDVNESISLTSVAFQHHALPHLVITSPTSYEVARPLMLVQVDCTDPEGAGCTQLTAAVNNNIIATGTKSIKTTVSLSAYIGTPNPTMSIQAKDALGQTVSTQIPIAIVAFQNMTLVDSIPDTSAYPQDVQGSEVLFTNRLGTVVTIRQMGGSETTIFNQKVVPSYLTPTGGAIFLAWPDNSPSNVVEYNGGVSTNLGQSISLAVTGGYAVWRNGTVLTERDLTTSTNIKTIANATAMTFGIGSTGDVVYSGPALRSQITFVPNSGSSVQVTQDTFYNLSPLTDGHRVVYIKSPEPSYTYGALNQITAWTASGGEVALTPFMSSLLIGPEYQINNGWIAYSVLNSSGEIQIWSSSPDNVNRQVSNFSTADLEGVGANGEVIFNNAQQRYLSVPPYTSTISLGTAYGTVLWRNGGFYVLVPGTGLIFHVQY